MVRGCPVALPWAPGLPLLQVPKLWLLDVHVCGSSAFSHLPLLLKHAFAFVPTPPPAPAPTVFVKKNSSIHLVIIISCLMLDKNYFELFSEA